MNCFYQHNEQLVLYPDPILLNVSRKVEDLEPWAKLVPVMFDLMNKYNGCGLAAPQIGISYAVFVLNVTRPMAVINPVIVSQGDRMWEEIEGCLSLPGQKFKVIRPRKIKARWLDVDGKEQCATFEGWTSRAFQHEYDHLSGTLINQIGTPIATSDHFS